MIMPTAVETTDFGFYVDGKWQSAGERIEIYSPGTRQLVGTTYRATAAHAEAAIAAAVRAFETTRRLGGYESHQRKGCPCGSSRCPG